MRPWSGGGRFTRVVAAVSVLSVVSLAFMSFANVSPRGVAGGSGNMRVITKTDAARVKVHPLLLQKMTDAPNAAVQVYAYVKAGTDLRRYMPDALARAFVDPAGNTFVTGTLKARDALKVASSDGVLALAPTSGVYGTPRDVDSDGSANALPSAEVQAQMTARMQSGVRGHSGTGTGNDNATRGWFDVLDTHQASLAWDKGYTGEGVKVMVNDSGTDFATPDLIGTWATVDDPSSPYYGWPMMFDSASMYLAARDFYLGEDNIGDGISQYADTRATISAAAPTYQLLDAAEPYTFTLPGTSMSGTYHIGTHPDNSLRTWYRIHNGLDLGDPDIADERAAVLVADEHEPGVYDTVYVDLDFDYDFSDEKPVSKNDPIVGADWWGAFDEATGNFDPNPDGWYDQSGGLVYWVSDGVNPIPAQDWWWGMGVAGNGAHDDGEPLAGDLVLFTIQDFARDGDHGTRVASNVAGQGRADGETFHWVLEGDEDFGLRPDFKPDGTQGMVVGPGKDVKIVSNGYVFRSPALDEFTFAALGLDGVPGTDDDIQIIQNSWGSTVELADGWDFGSRYIDFINRSLGPNLLVVFSAGNDGPGYGSLSGPEPPSALSVGASTQWGSTGMDSIASVEQIVYGDAAWFTSRGPAANGDVGVEVMADGQRASGSVPLAEALSGAHAWDTWGGTSRSAPVTSGIAALVYQAYKEAHGVWPDFDTAKAILMSSARDLNFDPFIQGAGMVNANRAVDLAADLGGGYVWPGSWTAGDYQGSEWPGFANLLTPGETDQGNFTITNTGDSDLTYSVSDRWLQRMDMWETTWTSNPIDEEPIEIDEADPSATGFWWHRPHYLWNITDLIPEGTDVLLGRYDYLLDQLDPWGTFDFNQTQNWQLLFYDWTDVNGDGNLWSDNNGNGLVDEGEIDEGEYIRYDYSRPFSNTAQITIQDPLNRHHDGIFMGLQHRQAIVDIPQTTFQLGLEFFANVDFPWLSSTDSVNVPAHGSTSFDATVEVPGDAAPGFYEGHLLLDDGSWTSAVPVVVNVAARNYNIAAGDDPFDGYFDNGMVRGAQDISGNYVQGDYRHFMVDLPEDPAGLGSRMESGTQYFLIDLWWERTPSDINVHVLGPTPDDFSAMDPDYYGPYTLAQIGASNDGFVTAGAFFTDTTSGTSREVIAAPYVPGLNNIVLHQVVKSGVEPAEEIALRAGALAVSESPIEVSRAPANPDFSVEETIISTLPLSGLVVQGFGLSKPEVLTDVPILQDDPNDPFTSSFTREVTLENAGILDITTDGQDADDIDLYLLFDANGDGEFDGSELIAASTSGSADEQITLTLPPDGDYLILVHGWAVPAGESTFDFALNAVQGDAISTSGLPEGEVQANQRYTFNIDMMAEGLEPGTYFGLVTLGPPEGPAAVLIPVTYEIRGE